MEVLNVVSDPTNDQMTIYAREGGKIVRRAVKNEYVCYLAKDDVDRELLRSLRGSRHIGGITQEGNWVRLQWKSRYARETACDPVNGWFAKQGVATYEGDVSPKCRWFADHPEVQIARPRRVWLDIETDARVSMLHKEEMRILCWVLIDENDNEIHGVLDQDTDASERYLLEQLWRALWNYDQVLAWNGDRFDFPVIFARSKKARIPVDARKWLWLDHLEVYRRMNTSESGDEKQSMALQSVAMSILKEGKVEGFEASKIFPAWEAGGVSREALLQYCVQDVRLMRKIEKKTGYVELMHTLCEVSHVLPDSYGLKPMPQVEQFMLRLGRERDTHFKTRNRHGGDEGAEEQSEGFRGAFVMEPKCHGIVRDVHVVDFTSMYPSIILSWNMSPETVQDSDPLEDLMPMYLADKEQEVARPEGTCAVPNAGVYFGNEPRGLLAVALETLLGLRKEWSAKAAQEAPGSPSWLSAMRRSTAYKIAANSFFGVVGSPVSRLYERSVAESITGIARWLIHKTLDNAEQMWAMKAVYGDTDSGFLQGADDAKVREFVSYCNDTLYPTLTKEQGCTRNAVKLAYEKKFERVVFVSAKRYIGRYSHYKGSPANEKSTPEVKGLEYKRGDTVRIARRFQAEVIDLLMGGGVEIPACGNEPARRTIRGDVCAETAAEFRALVGRYQKLVLEGELGLDDVKLSKKLTKPVKEYVVRKKKDGTDGAAPPHVRIAKMLMERGEEVGVGSRVEYVVLDEIEKVLIPACDWKGEFDRFAMWESYAWPPVQRLLEAAFPSENWALEYGRVRPRKVRGTSRTIAAKNSLKEEKPPQLGLFALKR